jgi:hypothetical protein
MYDATKTWNCQTVCGHAAYIKHARGPPQGRSQLKFCFFFLNNFSFIAFFGRLGAGHAHV